MNNSDKGLELYCRGHSHQLIDGDEWSKWYSREGSTVGPWSGEFEGLITGGVGEKSIAQIWKKLDPDFQLYSLYGVAGLDVADTPDDRRELNKIKRKLRNGIYD
jgi:hypothetical protein